jgi:hypothetical protein
VDDADRAQEYEQRHLAAALERAASLARASTGNRVPTSLVCPDCGGEIEAVRIAYGFGLCAACAIEAERQGGRR